MTCSAKGIRNVAINHAAPVAPFQLFANDVFTPQADKFQGFFPTGGVIIIVAVKVLYLCPIPILIMPC